MHREALSAPEVGNGDRIDLAATERLEVIAPVHVGGDERAVAGHNCEMAVAFEVLQRLVQHLTTFTGMTAGELLPGDDQRKPNAELGCRRVGVRDSDDRSALATERGGEPAGIIADRQYRQRIDRPRNVVATAGDGR